MLWRDTLCRVILAAEPDYPGFCRVIWNAHVKEMTDLDSAQRDHFMHVVFSVEQALRACLAADKINLGNLTPHLHWHVIPRFRDDRHFPNPVWGSPMRDVPKPETQDVAAPLREALSRLL